MSDEPRSLGVRKSLVIRQCTRNMDLMENFMKGRSSGMNCNAHNRFLMKSGLYTHAWPARF